MIIEEDFEDFKDCEEDSENKYNIYTIVTEIENKKYILSTSNNDTDLAIKFILDKMIEKFNLTDVKDIKEFKEKFRSDITKVQKCRTKIKDKDIFNILII
jgi:hypothetical protein